MVGVITLSLELELGWGMHDMGEFDHLSEDRSAETRTLRRLLDVTERFDIPITFAIVGHLFHESCDGSHTGPYPDYWWTEDPGTNREENPLFYAQDLVSDIDTSTVDHEIASHTYSHILAEEASSQMLESELQRVHEVHDDFGLSEPTSIVMPRHQEPDYSILADYGIETIRRPVRDYGSSISNPISKAWWLWSRSHPKSTIRQKEGILETTVTPHPSLTATTLPEGQSPPHTIFSAIPKHLRKQRHRRYLKNAIDIAVNEQTHVHLWTHLFNLSNDDQWSPVEDALGYLAQRRDDEQVLIRSMNQLGPNDDDGTTVEE